MCYFCMKKGPGDLLGEWAGEGVLGFKTKFLLKDGVGFVIVLAFALLLVLGFPDLLGDVENFNPANPMSTPQHIQPEWYYLFAYAILRAVPRKLGGVVALLCSVLVLYLLPYGKSSGTLGGGYGHVLLFWGFVLVFFILS